jgi:hypothetical protein
VRYYQENTLFLFHNADNFVAIHHQTAAHRGDIMSNKLIVRSFKLQPETLNQIQDFASKHGLTFSEAMRESVRSLNRTAYHSGNSEELSVTLENVTATIRVLEQNISQLVDVLAENIERNDLRLIFLLDRVQRLYVGSRLNSALGEQSLSSAALSAWQEKKAKLIEQFKSEGIPQ